MSEKVSAYSETKNKSSLDRLKFDLEHVGFSSLPEQVHRKSLKKGFEFTLLVVGDSGMGKSTLVNSLFMTDLYADRVLDKVTDKYEKTISITTRTAELEEKGVKLKLTVVDTPGFGDSLNASESWKKIAEYVDDQFCSYYTHESGCGLERRRLNDTRVHCCLYFLPPHVRGLRPIDIETMRCLQTRVNIVPVIGKADALTKSELEALKIKILTDIDKYDIKIYEFPTCDSDDDEEFKKLDEKIKNSIPFGIIGSNTVMEVGGKRIRGRAYPWGIIDIESESCDFSKLRTFLCSSHMQDLKDLTHDTHYENYRTELIKATTLRDSSKEKHSRNDTEKLLQQKEDELKKLQELVFKMQQNMTSTDELDQRRQKSMKTFGKSTFNTANTNCTIIKPKSNEFCSANKNTLNYNFKPQTNFQNLSSYQTSSTAI